MIPSYNQDHILWGLRISRLQMRSDASRRFAWQAYPPGHWLRYHTLACLSAALLWELARFCGFRIRIWNLETIHSQMILFSNSNCVDVASQTTPVHNLIRDDDDSSSDETVDRAFLQVNMAWPLEAYRSTHACNAEGHLHAVFEKLQENLGAIRIDTNACRPPARRMQGDIFHLMKRPRPASKHSYLYICSGPVLCLFCAWCWWWGQGFKSSSTARLFNQRN